VVLPLRLCVLYGSQNKQLLLPYTTLAVWFRVTEVESVYCAVGTESLYKTDLFSLYRVNVTRIPCMVADIEGGTQAEGV
jgi:hypothetical protein